MKWRREGRKEHTHIYTHTHCDASAIICVRPPRPQLYVCVCVCVCFLLSCCRICLGDITQKHCSAFKHQFDHRINERYFFKWLSQRVINFLSWLISEANRFHSPETDFTSISAYQRFFCLLCKCKLWNSVSAAAEHQILPLKSVQQRVQHDKCFPFFMTYWWTWFTNIVKAVTAGTGNIPHTWITSPLMPPVCW